MKHKFHSQKDMAEWLWPQLTDSQKAYLKEKILGKVPRHPKQEDFAKWIKDKI